MTRLTDVRDTIRLVNLRFPEIFGLVLLVAILCSFGLPRSVSGRIENSFQFVFAPVAGPIQWMTSNAATPARRDEVMLPDVSDDVVRLRAEKAAVQVELERLRGQLETLRYRAAEAERVDAGIRERAVPTKVIGMDGRDAMRLAGASTPLVVEAGAPVVFEGGGLVGRVAQVGLGNQSSVRLITDRGFKLLARFGRYVRQPDGNVRFELLGLPEAVVEGRGGGEMRIDSLKLPDVARAALKVGDLALLSDVKTAEWPIEVHGYRIGAVSFVGERSDAPGVAEVRVRPEVDLSTLKDVLILGKKG